ncbi:MAG: sigma-70 family RNA polymerase sigma factor [Pirellulales bacterium]|nr:sigma-70 family RNA polymerase sigma factor [Pirellulales bacterium]
MSQPNIPAATVSTLEYDFSVTWEEHRRWLRTVVWARLGEPQAVEEVLQEVALAAAKGFGTVRDPKKMGPWLYQVAIRRVLLHRRRMGRDRRFQERYAADRSDPQPPQTEDPLHWLLAEERRALLRRALDRLPRRDAEILLLKYTEDWTYRQVAEHLGITTSAVEARLHRARRRMRSILAALDPELQHLTRHEHV